MMSQSNESFLCALQLENDTLRRQLRQTKEEMGRSLQQIHREYMEGRRDAEEKNGGDCDVRHIECLERRCEVLATRLVAIVRNRQLSESSEVHFLLRTQEEERRFLRDALVTLLRRQKKPTVVGVGCDYMCELEKEAHPGMLSALIMKVTESIQSSEATLKLEQAERLMLLEQSTDLIADIQGAIEKAARCVYSYHVDLLHAESLQRLMPWGEPQSFSHGRKMKMLAGATSDRPPFPSFHTQRSSNHTDSFMEPELNSLHQMEGVVDSFSRKGDLYEACDMLRACHRALAGVRSLFTDMMSKLTPAISSQGGEKTSALERLMEGFHRDLQEMTQSNEKCRETLARRLEAEIEAHRQTVQRYEARLKLAERELVDHLTSNIPIIPTYSSSSAHTTRKSLGGNETNAPIFPKKNHKEVEKQIIDAVLTPSSTTRTTTMEMPLEAKGASLTSQHGTKGNTARCEFTPENVTQLSSNQRDEKLVLEGDRGNNDGKGRIRESIHSGLSSNTAVSNVVPPPRTHSSSLISRSSLRPAVSASSMRTPVQPQRRRESASLSSLDTLDDGMHSDSLCEGSVTHSPPSSPSSGRWRSRVTSQTQSYREVMSTQRQTRWPCQRILLSPSAY